MQKLAASRLLHQNQSTTGTSDGKISGTNSTAVRGLGRGQLLDLLSKEQQSLQVNYDCKRRKMYLFIFLFYQSTKPITGGVGRAKLRDLLLNISLSSDVESSSGDSKSTISTLSTEELIEEQSNASDSSYVNKTGTKG